MNRTCQITEGLDVATRLAVDELRHAATFIEGIAFHPSETTRRIIAELRHRADALDRSRQRSEGIDWHRAADRPDADLIVLLYGSWGEPVWPGYWDGETYRTAEGRMCEPEMWAEMPMGPG